MSKILFGRGVLALVCAVAASACTRSAPEAAPDAKPAASATTSTVAGAPFDVSAVMRQVSLAYRQTDNGWLGGHGTYDVQVGDEGLALRAFHAPKNETIESASLKLGLAQVSVGGQALALGATTAQRQDDGTLRLNRRIAAESLVNRAEGVEQSWHFDARPAGQGDLMVAVPVAGLEYAGVSDTGLHFRDPATGLGFRYGHGTWIDAAGERTAVPAKFAEGRILLAVNEKVLASSAFPAVLDPVVSPEFGMDQPVVGTEPSAQLSPSVASNGSEYLVVWQDMRTGFSNIYATRVSEVGQILDPEGIAMSLEPAPQGPPAVASNGTNWLVTWRQGGSIRGTRLDATGAIIGVAGSTLSATASGDPAVASNGADYFVVWTVSGQVLGTRVNDSLGTVVDSPPVIVSLASSSASAPSVASVGSDYFVAWTQSDGTWSVHGARVEGTGLVQDPAGIVIASGTSDNHSPVVASNGTVYLVAWEQYGATGWDIFYTRVNTAGVALEGVGGAPVANVNGHQSIAAASSNGEDFLIVWRDLRNGTNWALYAARVSAAGVNLDPGHFLITDAMVEEAEQAIASSGGDTYLVVSRYRAPVPDGIVYQVHGRIVDVENPPVASNATVTTDEDTALAITLEAVDPDGDALTWSIVDAPANGTLTGTAPNLTYTPTENVNGADSFTFKVNDGTSDSNAATVSVSVTAVNDAPVADAQELTTAEETAKAITLTASDVEGDPLTFLVAEPLHGTLVGEAPHFTYTPHADYAGPDGFTFEVFDGTVSASATVSITVTGVNDAPVATAQVVVTDEDTAAAITLAGTDPDGDELTFAMGSIPQHGTLRGVLPELTYSPDANYFGADSFTFKVNDGTVDSAFVTVSITVTSVNDVPNAQSRTLVLAEDSTAAVTLAGSDIETGSLTFAVVALPLHGTLSGVSPALVYTPDEHFNGDDSFTYRATDGTDDSSPVTVSLTVTPVNDAPVADAQTITTSEETAKAIVLTGSDVDGDTLSYVVLTGPASGTLEGEAPHLTYTPNADFHGGDAITFRVSDGALNSTEVVVSFTVSPVNDAPVADTQSVVTEEDTARAITLTASDVDGDSLSYTVLGGPAHGTLTGDAPNVTYTPDQNFHGTDSFIFQANDGVAESEIITVSLEITAVNDAPVANAQAVITDEDEAAAITLVASDVDGDDVTFTVTAEPMFGTLTGEASNLVYTPNADFHGADSFTFTASDGSLTSNEATVSLTINAVNDAPVAVAQVVSGNEDSDTLITLAGTDTEESTLLYAVVAEPSHGTLSGVAPNLTYTPAQDFNGADSFTFTVNDGTATSEAVTVSLEIAAVNDAPVASVQSVTTDEDTSKAVTLLASDLDGDVVTYIVVTEPEFGTLTGEGAELTYQPNADYTGADSFTFKVNDGALDSNEAAVSITVNAVNDTPVADAQSVVTDEDTAVELTLAAGDVEGDALTFTVASEPTNGTLSGEAPNLTYTPEANFNGTDSFTFTVNDGTAESVEATVSITVDAINDAPVADAQSVATNEDVPVAITLVAADLDGDELTYTVVTEPLHGTFTLEGSSLSYQPAANYYGPDSFTFRVNDGALDSEIATVELSVVSVNDAPIADAQSLVLDEDVVTEVTLSGSDVDGDTLTYAVVVEPQHGTLSGLAPDLTYTPDADFNGADSFTFTVKDGLVDSLEATVSFDVKAVNDAPVAVAQALTTDEDVELAVTLTATDIEEDSVSFAVIDEPSHGTLTGTAPELTYVPDAHYFGADSFTFKVNDGQVDSAVATVSLEVVSVNDAPVALAIEASTPEDEAVAVTLAGTDIDGDALGFVEVTAPLFGTLSGTAPDLTYTPHEHYNGPDSFTYLVNDGVLDSMPATVSLVVGPINDAPVAEAGAATTDEDAPVEIALVAGDLDGDAIEFSVVTAPQHGTLSGTGPAFTYTPEAHYFGADSFTFRVNDGLADSNVATVSLEVVSVDDVPVSSAQAVVVTEDMATNIKLHATDIDGHELTWVVVTRPKHGTLSGTPPDVTYRPVQDFVGADSFTFLVNANEVDSNEATVTITVQPSVDVLEGGGAGCSSTGGGFSGLGLLLLAGLFLLRQKRMAILLAAVCLPLAAQAQLPSIEVQSLRLNPGAAGSLVTQSGLLLDKGTLRLALTGHHEQDSLVYSRNGQQVGSIVGNRETTHLSLAWAPADWLEFGAELPAIVMQGGDDLSQYGLTSVSSAALGTAVVQIQAAPWQQRNGGFLDVAFRMGMHLPLGGDAALASESGLSLMQGIGVGRELTSWLRVGAELGVVLRPDTAFDGETLSRTAFEGAVVLHTLGQGLRGELGWRGSTIDGADTSSSEVLAGVRLPVGKRVEIYGLGGLGLGSAPGTPAWRALAGVSLSLGGGATTKLPKLVDPEPAPTPVVHVAPEPVEPEPMPEPQPVAAVQEAVVVPVPTAQELAALGERIDAELSRARMFASESFTIEPDALPALEKVASMLQENPGVETVTVEGYTDASGSKFVNAVLSVARAHAVREFLIDNGVAPGRVRVVGAGEQRPVAPNNTRDGRQANRRVEFVLGASR